MGVYIKGMKMPDKCGHCRFATAFECEVTKNFITTFNVRQQDCPLVPVPPHGIIDREQILDAIRLELAQANAVNDMDDYDEWMRVFDYIRKFPTIIPTEEEQ